jgi:hypothetical protein
MFNPEKSKIMAQTFYVIKQSRDDKFLSSEGFWTSYVFSKEFKSETEALEFIDQLASSSLHRPIISNVSFVIEKYHKYI